MMKPFKLAALTLAPFALLVTIPDALAAPQAATDASLDPKALALGHEIVAIAFPPERRQAMMEQVMGTMLGQMKAGMSLEKISDPGLKAILLDYIDGLPQLLRPTTSAFIPRQMDAIAQAYARMFPLAELQDIAAFARTPSGKHFMQRSTDVLSDPSVAAVNTEYFRQAQTLAQASAVQLGQKVKDYVAVHPEAAKGLTPPAN